MNTSKYISNYPDVLKPKDVMVILGIGKNTVYKMLKSGELKSIKVGKQYRIPKKYLLQYLGA
ncbi:MAG: helix-turn-helix domain-containing protein [Clostridiales bacterium]|nr:helix-turn-helix domain-containing protein [Clostridiales bacterium]